jgi:formylglycine-generating enzyme required for sulfatase activity
VDTEDAEDLKSIDNVRVRVVRGRSFNDQAIQTRFAAYSFWNMPSLRNAGVGFRPARTFR